MSTNSKAMNHYGILYIKAGILLFWFCWFTLAFLTNTLDAINAFCGLPSTWVFRSGNYEALNKVLQIYHTPSSLLNWLFAFNIFTQGISGLLFFTSFIYFLIKNQINHFTNIAFGISMALWAIFIIMEEIFIAYSYESTHMRLFAFEMLSLLFLHLLPHEKFK